MSSTAGTSLALLKSSKYVQITVGLVVIIGLFLASRHVLDKASQHTDVVFGGNAKTPVWIIRGIADSRALHQRSINTFNPQAPNYRQLPRSVNRFGGAQFSYVCWMKLSNTDRENVAGKTILLRGDPKPYPLTKIDRTQNNTQVTPTGYKTSIVKCPSIKFGSSINKFVIECNTTNDVEQTFVAARHDTNKHVFDLIPGRWVMLTVVLEDNIPIDDFENGIRARMFLNGELVMQQSAFGALRINNGDLHLLPNQNLIEGALFANVRYYPWALTGSEVSNLFAKGLGKDAKACNDVLSLAGSLVNGTD